MKPRACRTTMLLIALFLLAAGCTRTGAPDDDTKRTRYEDLVTLFEEWRTFQKPPLVEGVPDYSPEAMAAQHRALAAYQRRLAGIDTSGWPVAHRVDYQLIGAEMNGLDFDHRMLRPWARNPAFYAQVFPSQSDVPAREGPVAYGAIELWTYPFPLSSERAADLRTQLQTLPTLLDQARANLVGNARDLWLGGIQRMRRQGDDLAQLAGRVAGIDALLEADVQRAREATEAFLAWLEEEAPSKTGPSGVGVEQYTWYLQNVHLVPYTWEEEVTIMQRELARAHAALRLEEHRNRELPPLTPIASAEDYDRRFQAAVTEYMAFLREEEVVSIRDYMEAALRARIGRFRPADGLRGFFSEVNYRDPLVMRTHHYHWIDLARMVHEPHASPIRRGPLLYNIFDGRAEGLATGMEEMMMHAGLFEDRPRARELIWVLLAQRAARALGGLYMHANEYSMEQARQFASEWTPRGWLPQESATNRFEQHLYLQQPGYGTSYVIGKIEIETLLAERARQLGDDFTLKRFMDELDAAGMIPVSLIRWEMTGRHDNRPGQRP
ncbi:MAG: DUF885 family protein [Rhodothermales bacterium]